MIIEILCSSKVNKYITNKNGLKIGGHKLLSVDHKNKEKTVTLKLDVEKFISVHQFLEDKKIQINIQNEDIIVDDLLKENNDLVLYILELPCSCITSFCCLMETACEYSNVGMILYILSLYECYNLMDNAGLLKKLFERGDCTIMKAIIRTRKFVIDNLIDLLHEYICVDNSKMVGWLINYIESSYENTDFFDVREHLIYCMQENSISCVEYFLNEFEDGIEECDVSEKEFIECIKSNKTEIVQLFLTEVDFSQKWINNIFINCYEYDPETTKMLINAGADVEKYVCNIIKKAKKNNRKDMVKYLKSYCKEKGINY